jgi:hypothetical protein
VAHPSPEGSEAPARHERRLPKPNAVRDPSSALKHVICRYFVTPFRDPF